MTPGRGGPATRHASGRAGGDQPSHGRAAQRTLRGFPWSCPGSPSSPLGNYGRVTLGRRVALTALRPGHTRPPRRPLWVAGRALNPCATGWGLWTRRATSRQLHLVVSCPHAPGTHSSGATGPTRSRPRGHATAAPPGPTEPPPRPLPGRGRQWAVRSRRPADHTKPPEHTAEPGHMGRPRARSRLPQRHAGHGRLAPLRAQIHGTAGSHGPGRMPQSTTATAGSQWAARTLSMRSRAPSQHRVTFRTRTRECASEAWP